MGLLSRMGIPNSLHLRLRLPFPYQVNPMDASPNDSDTAAAAAANTNANTGKNAAPSSSASTSNTQAKPERRITLQGSSPENHDPKARHSFLQARASLMLTETDEIDSHRGGRRRSPRSRSGSAYHGAHQPHREGDISSSLAFSQKSNHRDPQWTQYLRASTLELGEADAENEFRRYQENEHRSVLWPALIAASCVQTTGEALIGWITADSEALGIAAIASASVGVCLLIALAAINRKPQWRWDVLMQHRFVGAVVFSFVWLIPVIKTLIASASRDSNDPWSLHQTWLSATIRVVVIVLASPLIGWIHAILLILLHVALAVASLSVHVSYIHIAVFLIDALPSLAITVYLARSLHILSRVSFMQTSYIRMVEDIAAQKPIDGKKGSMVAQMSHARLNRSRSNATVYVDGIDDWMKRINSRGSIVQKPGTDKYWRVESDDVHLISRVTNSTIVDYYRAKYRAQDAMVRLLSVRKSSDTLSYFEAEVATLFSLRHSNIVNMLGACVELLGTFCIITEFLPRGNLFDVLNNPKLYLNGEKIQRMMLSIAQGMSFLHNREAPILHLNLNSLNVMVDDGYNLKISEFGMVRFKRLDLFSHKISLPAWISPEILLGEEGSQKSDVYSFGVIMCELVSRRRVFENLFSFQVLFGVCFDKIRPSIPDHCPLEYIKVISSCLEHNPESRPSFERLIMAIKKLTPLSHQLVIETESESKKQERLDENHIPAENEVRVDATVVEARNIHTGDIHGILDTYVVVKYGRVSYKTGIAQNTILPVWKEMFSFPSLEPNDNFHFSIYNSHAVRGEEKIGECVVTSGSLSGIVSQDRWYPVTAASNKFSRDAELRISFSVYKKDDEDKQEEDTIEIKPVSVKIQDKVANGSFGEVYRARWNSLQVSVKKLYMKRLSHTVWLSMRSDLEALCEIRHDHIIRHFGGCFKAGNLFIVTEFAEKGSLYDLLHTQHFERTDGINYAFALDICRGIQFLHSQTPQIIHGSLSSHNVLVSRNYLLKISDPGLIPVKQECACVSFNSTLCWMAPEIIRCTFVDVDQKQPISTNADMYALGMIVFEIFVREEPFPTSVNASEIARKIVYEGLRPRLPDTLSTEMWMFLVQSWDGDPAMRPSVDQAMDTIWEDALEHQLDPTSNKGHGLIPLQNSSPENPLRQTKAADGINLLNPYDKDQLELARQKSNPYLARAHKPSMTVDRNRTTLRQGKDFVQTIGSPTTSQPSPTQGKGQPPVIFISDENSSPLSRPKKVLSPLRVHIPPNTSYSRRSSLPTPPHLPAATVADSDSLPTSDVQPNPLRPRILFPGSDGARRRGSLTAVTLHPKLAEQGSMAEPFSVASVLHESVADAEEYDASAFRRRERVGE